jgi:hypothetical protein
MSNSLPFEEKISLRTKLHEIRRMERARTNSKGQN